jgi:hypothetical protein
VTKLFKALLLSSFICYGSALAWAESIGSIDPVAEAAKPQEREDGTLDFTGLSNPDIARFQAEQTYLMNRRLALMSQLLTGQNEDKPELFSDLDEALKRTVRTWLPNVPDGQSNFGRYLYRNKPAP